MAPTGLRTDRATRVIKAPAAAIYRAFVEPEALIGWLPPEGMRGEMQLFEPREGGRYRMALTYESGDGGAQGKTTADSDVVEGHFVEIAPDRRIVQAAMFESDDPAFAGTMTITWTFFPVVEGTRVDVACENVPKGIRKEDHDAGLASSLANLARFVE